MISNVARRVKIEGLNVGQGAVRKHRKTKLDFFGKQDVKQKRSYKASESGKYRATCKVGRFLIKKHRRNGFAF